MAAPNDPGRLRGGADHGSDADLVRRVVDQVGERAMVAWVHAAAVARHATAHGFVPLHRVGGTDPRPALEWMAAAHPALTPFCDPTVNPIWDTPLAPGLIGRVSAMWFINQQVTGQRGVDGYTRYDGYELGDLYQSLSKEARKGRALCQTPPWITEVLLWLSWDRAVEESDQPIRMIDPSCGTGHILVKTALHAWTTSRAGGHRHPRPRLPHDAEVEAALAAVHGVDLDPYAAAVTRYRLLALACSIRRNEHGYQFDTCPRSWPIQVAAANSLLDTAEPLLQPGQYDVVVANPPYITPKDPDLNAAVRAAYPEVAYRRYSLALPFHVLMHRLLTTGGWCAQLTANSFMKREFGRRYVEGWLTDQDIVWLIDTSGAYIPGHGTPTVIMVTRNQPPSADTVRAVLGNRGEPSRPADPAKGLVWSAIRSAVRERESLDRLARQMTAAGVKARPGVQVQDAPDKPPAPPIPIETARQRREAQRGQLDLFAQQLSADRPDDELVYELEAPAS